MIEILALVLYVIIAAGMIFGPSPYQQPSSVTVPEQAATEARPQSAS
jgi:hypothetical protein